MGKVKDLQIITREQLVDAVIEDLKQSFAIGDYTVLDELLHFIPTKNLIQALPEERWKEFDNVDDDEEITEEDLIKYTPFWSEIHDDFEDEGFIHIDAWSTADDDEQGKVIAKINVQTKEVIYLDERAKINEFAQEVIQERLKTM